MIDTFVDEATGCITAYGRNLATSFGGHIEESAGVLMCDAELAWSARNMVVPLRPLEADNRRNLADRLIEFYGSRARGRNDVFATRNDVIGLLATG